MADAQARDAATIQPFSAEDEKKVLFIIGKTAFESLASANVKLTTHPVTIAAYLALASSLVQYLKWWPHPVQNGYIDLLRPLPIFAAMILPITFLIDFLQRSSFEERAQTVLKAPDARALRTHYNTPPSGLWILRLGAGFVGLVALDASSKTDTPRIRHIYVDEPFRKVGAQTDLIKYALDQAFANKRTKAVRIEVDPLRQYVRDGARQTGFKFVEESKGTIGLLGWKMQEWEITKEQWERSKGSS